MTSLPDKQFRDSLEHYKKSPPPQAWDRIETGLHKNKSRTIWVSAAAAFLLLISASFLLWHSSESQTTTPSAAMKQMSGNEITNTISVPQSPRAPIASPVKETDPVLVSPSQKTISKQKTTPLIQEEANATATVSNETLSEVPIAQTQTTAISSEPTPRPVTTADASSSSLRSNKIVYSSGEVNSRFLKKESSASVAIVPAPEKPQTGIKKIIEIASNLKYEENALGELREMKNEILSLPRKEATADKNK